MRSLLIVLVLATACSAYYQRCTPGTSFTNGCNTCVCSIEGRSVCTTKICQSGSFKPGNSYQHPVEQIQQIIPGASHIEIIPAQQIGESHVTSFQVCTPNAFFQIGCNRCRCSMFGDTYSCTKFACVPQQPKPNLPGQKNPQQGLPNYPVPNYPKPQPNPPQGYPTFPEVKVPHQQPNQQGIPNYPGQQQKPQQGSPTFPKPSVPDQKVPEHQHKHGCGHHHKH